MHGYDSQRERQRAVASGAQCRAARGLLNWTQTQVADAAGVARKTIADFESGERPLRWRTRRDITETLERAGIAFEWSAEKHREGVSWAMPAPAGFTGPRLSSANRARPDAT